jgi:hypothetical protein
MNITIDENGNVVDQLKDRNEEIKEKLEPILSAFVVEKNEMMKMKKPVKLGFRFTKQLLNVLSSYGQMTAEKVAQLDFDTINDYWLKYLELTAYYNLFFEIVDNKQLFMMFMGINDRIYKQLMNHDDEDIRNLMCTINSSYIGLGYVASESGNADSKAVTARLGAKGVGHDVVSASEEMVAQAVATRTPNELAKDLERIMGVKINPKLLN